MEGFRVGWRNHSFGCSDVMVPIVSCPIGLDSFAGGLLRIGKGVVGQSERERVPW